MRMYSTGYEKGDAHIRLLVKAPDQQIDDQTVECRLNWTVARLKGHLAQVYPSKPKHEEQKIIYLGQLLNDSMILRDVLQQDYNKENSLFIVHLVCAGQSKSSSTGKTVLSSLAVNVNDQAATFVSAGSAPVRHTPVQQYHSQLNNQQMVWMQQAYTHYLTRYMQIMAARGIQVESNPLLGQPLNVNMRASGTTNNNNATTMFNNVNNVEENEAVDNEVAQGPGLAMAEGAQGGLQQVAGNENVANNNHNAPVNGPVGGAAPNRDWLDIFDMLSRIIVLSSIVYFYSSPSRFLIVTFLGFAIYLIQGGFFRGQPAFLADNTNARVVNNNNPVRQNEGIPPGDQTPAPAQQPLQIPSGTLGEQHGEATRTNLNGENERPGVWAFTWTFFSSFFASLIPDQPNVI